MRRTRATQFANDEHWTICASIWDASARIDRIAPVVGCIVSDPIIIVAISLAHNFIASPRCHACDEQWNAQLHILFCVGVCVCCMWMCVCVCDQLQLHCKLRLHRICMRPIRLRTTSTNFHHSQFSLIYNVASYGVRVFFWSARSKCQCNWMTQSFSPFSFPRSVLAVNSIVFSQSVRSEWIWYVSVLAVMWA